MKAHLVSAIVILSFVVGRAVGDESQEAKDKNLATALILTGFTRAAVAKREQVLRFLQTGDVPKELAERRAKAAAETRESMTRMKYALGAVHIVTAEFSDAEAMTLVEKLEDPLVKRWFDVVLGNSRRFEETLDDWRKQVLHEYNKSFRSD